MKNETTPTASDWEGIKARALKIAPELELGKVTDTQMGRKYRMRHPADPPRRWVFCLDWDWVMRRRVRFWKGFIPVLQRAGLLASVESGAGENCSVDETHFESALRLVVAELRAGAPEKAHGQYSEGS